MKKFLFLALIIACSFPAMGQKSGPAFFRDLSRANGVDQTVKKASAGIYNNYIILDSLIYFTRTLETSVLQGKQAGSITPALVKTAQKRFPGTSKTALTQRLQYYATEGKNGLPK